MTEWSTFRNNCLPLTSDIRIPASWGPSSHVKWRIELSGYGQSSPVSFGKYIYVTSVKGSQRDHNVISCIDSVTGKDIWMAKHETSLKHEMSYYVSRAAPTPICDESGVIALFESGDIYAHDPKGKLRWSRSLSREYGMPSNEFGLGSSPTQTKTNVIIVRDDPSKSYICALNKATGATVWKTDREPRKSWTSPIVVNIDGLDVVVISSNGDVDFYDAATGKMIGNFGGLRGNIMASCTSAGGDLLIGATSAQARLAKPSARYSPTESNCCLSVRLVNGKVQSEAKWLGDNALCDFASPVVSGKLAYYVTASGIVHCVDKETGKGVFAERIDTPCWASPIVQSDRILFFGKNGVTTALATGKTFRKLGAYSLWTEGNTPLTKEAFTNNSPGGRTAPPSGSNDSQDPIVYAAIATQMGLYMRTGSHLFCIA
jgi:outer membrane protein assembly factor BamB